MSSKSPLDAGLPAEDSPEELRARLEEANETLHAIRRGEVDALLIDGRSGAEVYTLTAERPYRVMIEEMQEGALMAAADGTVLYCNRRFAEMAALPADALLGSGLPGRFGRQHQEVRRLLAGSGGKAELTLVAEGGGEIPVNVSAREVVEVGPGIYCVIVTDLTHHKHHERVRESERRLRESDRHKEEFLITLGHELRNPLAPIQHAIEVLRAERPTPQERVDWAVRMIGRQADHLSRLVSDLLDVNRINRGLLRLRRGRVDLVEQLQGVAEGARPQAEEHGLTLEVSLPDEPFEVEADETRLAQVISNLLHNAIKFTPTGGTVELSLRRADRMAEIVVRDDGVGIAPDFLPRVFELFSQGRRDGDARPGLGLGLSLARRLVEMHGGSIDAASAGPDRGSTFTVRLPAPRLAAPEPRPAEAAPELAAACRVLVVDDNRDAADALVLLLSHAGHRVEVAYDGGAALAAAAAFQPEVAVLDLDLPVVDGFELARRLRADLDDRVLLIALSGFGQERDRRRCREAGFDDHLVKPIKLDQLLRLLASRAAGVTG